jgi:hypothetical protein
MTVKQEQAEIAGRARRIDWEVEVGSGSSEWAYRITCPDGVRVQLHRTPSDVNWKQTVMRHLNRHGFARAEREWIANNDKERAEKLEKDRVASERRAATTAKKAAVVNSRLTKAAGPHAIHEPDIGWLTTPASVPESRYMRITPEVAQKILDTINSHNRPVRPSHVAYLARIMNDDEWGLTHQGGAIDWDGVLQDGQHRLLACVMSGKTIVMQWTVGVDPKNYAKVDVGSARTGRDFAIMQGIAHPTIAPSAARMLLTIEMYGSEAHVRQGKTKISLDRVQHAVEAYGEDLLDAISRALRIRRELKVNATGIAVAVYLIQQRLPEGDIRVQTFFNDIENGVNLGDADAARLLRRTIFRSRDTQHNAKRVLSAYEVAALIIKTWNARMSRRPLSPSSMILWRSNEPFPATVILPPPSATFTEPGNPEPVTEPERDLADSFA